MATSMIDNVLLNLKIISKIPEHGKVKRSEKGTLDIDTNNNVNWLFRYIRGDSRKKALEDISNTVDHAIEKTTEIINSKYFTEHNKFDINNSFILQKLDYEYYKQYDLLKLIFTELTNSVKGLINLKNTYSLDVTTVSKLDIIIVKINNHLEDIEKKIIEGC